MVVFPVMLCVCAARGPALPRDAVCTISDAYENHPSAVYVQNNVIRVLSGIIYRLYIILPYTYVLFKMSLFNLHPSAEVFILLVNIVLVHIRFIYSI